MLAFAADSEGVIGRQKTPIPVLSTDTRN